MPGGARGGLGHRLWRVLDEDPGLAGKTLAALFRHPYTTELRDRVTRDGFVPVC